MNRNWSRRLGVWTLGVCLATNLPAWAQLGGGATTPPAAGNQTPTPNKDGQTPAKDNAATAATGSAVKDPMVEEALNLLKASKLDEALKKLEEAAAKNKDYPPAKLMLARIFINSGQGPIGRNYVEQAALENPRHPDVYITLAGIALGESRFTDSVLNFQKTLEVMADPAWKDDQKKNIARVCADGMSAVSEKRGDWKGALTHLTDLLSKAQQITEKNDQTKKLVATTKLRLGMAQFWLDNLPEATNQLNAAFTEDSKIQMPGTQSQFTATGSVLGQLYTTKAGTEKDKAKRAELYKKAYDAHQAAVTADKNNAGARAMFTNWLIDFNYLDSTYLNRASQLVEELNTLTPNALDVRFLRGVIARWQKRFDVAENQFDSCMKEAPDNFPVANQYILTLLDQGTEPKLQLAQQQLEAFGKKFGRIPEAGATVGWYFFKRNNLDEAEKVLNQVMNTGQVSADAAYYVTRVLQERQKFDDSIKLLKSITEAQGNFFNRKDAEADLKRFSPKDAAPAK